MIVKIIVIALYALMIVLIGIMGLKKTKTFNDFFLGGGNVGPLMSAFSYGTAYFSAVLFIGFAGSVGWGFGYSGLWIAFFNAIIGVGVVWAVFGWRIKKMSMEYGVSTMSEFLEKRYNSSFIKMAAVIVIFIFMIPYTAAVFMGLSYLFELNFNIEYWQALVFMGAFTGIYIVMGGYKSMAMIDMIFGIIMIISVLMLFGFAVNKGGGLAAITEKLSSVQPKLTQWVGPAGIGNLFALVFLTSVAPFAMPQLVQKFYAIRDRKAVKMGMIFSTIFALIIGGVAYFLGSTTHVFFDPISTPHLFNNGAPYFDKLMPELLTSVIPASLVVVVLLLILSASMSTLASLVLISSSSIAKDLYAGFINKNASDKQLTMLMRIMSAVFIILAVLLALVKFDVIVEILGISWGAIGSFFLGPFVWGLLCKRVNKLGAISSSILGLTVCLAFYFIGLSMKGQALIVPWYFTAPGAGTVGMITSLLINPLFSSFCCKGSCKK